MVTVWDRTTGRVVHAIRGHDAGRQRPGLQPRRPFPRHLGLGRTVGLWDADSGRPVRTLAIRGLLVWAVAFTPDGRRVVAADNIGRMALWDSETGLEVLTLRGHPDRVYDLAFSADGRLMVSASRDTTAKSLGRVTPSRRRPPLSPRPFSTRPVSHARARAGIHRGPGPSPAEGGRRRGHFDMGDAPRLARRPRRHPPRPAS